MDRCRPFDPNDCLLPDVDNEIAEVAEDNRYVLRGTRLVRRVPGDQPRSVLDGRLLMVRVAMLELVRCLLPDQAATSGHCRPTRVVSRLVLEALSHPFSACL